MPRLRGRTSFTRRKGGRIISGGRGRGASPHLEDNTPCPGVGEHALQEPNSACPSANTPAEQSISNVLDICDVDKSMIDSSSLQGLSLGLHRDADIIIGEATSKEPDFVGETIIETSDRSPLITTQDVSNDPSENQLVGDLGQDTSDNIAPSVKSDAECNPVEDISQILEPPHAHAQECGDHSLNKDLEVLEDRTEYHLDYSYFLYQSRIGFSKERHSTPIQGKDRVRNRPPNLRRKKSPATSSHKQETLGSSVEIVKGVRNKVYKSPNTSPFIVEDLEYLSESSVSEDDEDYISEAKQKIDTLLPNLWLGVPREDGQHLVLVTDPEKGGDQYAFDNPCFRDASMVPRGDLEKKAPIGSDLKNKLSSWGQLGQLTAVRHVQQPNKRRAVDDSYTAAAQVKQVSLRSHDFAGLGFSICGNMRDGIFVKDMLHRGPASESGSIAPGDRIHSIRINLQHIVLEDALTILSYASPYEVTLEVESASTASSFGSFSVGASPVVSVTGNASSTSSLLRRERERLNATSADRIRHPYYRSQSIADLTQIGKTTSRRPHQLDISTCSLSSRDSINDHSTLKLQSPVTSKEDSLTTVASFSRDKMPYKGAVLSPSSCSMVKPERAKKVTTHEKESHSNTYNPETHFDHLHKFGVRVLPAIDKKSEEFSPETAKRLSKPGSTPEKHQNEHNTYLERGIDIPDNYSPYTSTPAKPDSHPDFHEIDLGESAIEKQDEMDHHHKYKETNVKTILTKGLRNIKDKLHSLERKTGRPKPGLPQSSPQEVLNEVGSTAHQSGEVQEKGTFAQECVMMRQPSGRGIPMEIPEEVRMAAMAARSNRKSVGPLTIGLEGEERSASRNSSASGDSNQDCAPCTAPKRGNKRKAPKPPEEELPKDMKSQTELMSEVSPPSDTESADDHKSVTVSLDDVKEKARKAASLVDLSRIDNHVPVGTLERAVSLDLVDGIPQGKKRKAPPVPSCSDGNVLSIDVDSDVILRKEPRLEGTLSTFETGRLKKSSDWGTLEEALKDAPSPDSTTNQRGSPTSSEHDHILVLSSHPMSDVISTNDSDEALSLGRACTRSEPYDSIPEVDLYSFDTYSSTTEPLSIEIKSQPQQQDKAENHRAKFLWAVPSEYTENRTVLSVTPDPIASQVSVSGPPSGPTSLTMVSSAPVNFDRISPDSTQSTHISLVTTMQLNSLEDSGSAFVTAGETTLLDEEELSITPPALPTSPIPVSLPSSLTYITEIQVKDNEAIPSPPTNGLEDNPKYGVEHDINGKYDSEDTPLGEEASPHFSNKTPETSESTVVPTQHSNPENTPTATRPTTMSTPTKASRNVSVTAIQGSRIPVRSTSLTPEDRGSRSPIRPPVPARRFSDHGLNTLVAIESPKRTIPRPKDERKSVSLSLNNGTNTSGITVKNGLRSNSEVRVVNASAKNDSD